MHFIAFARPDGAGGFGVDFPDAPGCVTHGRDLVDAEAMAAEALAGWLEVSLEYDDALVLPSDKHRTPKGATRLVVPVPAELGVRLTLRAGRAARGLTQAQLGGLLGISAQAVQKLERAGTNPKMETLARAAQALGVDFSIGGTVATTNARPVTQRSAGARSYTTKPLTQRTVSTTATRAGGWTTVHASSGKVASGKRAAAKRGHGGR